LRSHFRPIREISENDTHAKILCFTVDPGYIKTAADSLQEAFMTTFNVLVIVEQRNMIECAETIDYAFVENIISQ